MRYTKNVEIRWSDIDPNYHLRHSVYYDFGAFCRIGFLFDNGITSAVLHQHELGPVLFREECSFKREIIYGDAVHISLQLKSVSADFRKFTMYHEIYKNENELAAMLTIDGAWMHTRLRKIVAPPAMLIDALNLLPKTDDFRIV